LGFTKVIETVNAGEEGIQNALKMKTEELRKTRKDKTDQIKVLLFVDYSGTKIVLKQIYFSDTSHPRAIFQTYLETLSQ
jgi:hypothetical protein